MLRQRAYGICLVVGICLFSEVICFAQTPPASQTAGGITAQEKAQEKKKKLEQKIESPRTQVQETLTEEQLAADVGPKVFIKIINVEGVSLISQEKVSAITSQYEGKELSMKGMKKVADLITDEYRKMGFVTSRAYVPAQSVRAGLLLIKVIEGKMGDLEIRGNRYFKTPLLEKKLDLRPGGYFDYSALQKSLVYINEHPDRKAKVTLMPGKAAGTTDVVLDVSDRSPLHAGFEYDNYASRYLDKNRYAVVVENNNLFGFDDKAYLKFQTSDDWRLKLYQGRYSYPINPGFDLGGFFLVSRTKLGQEFKDLDAKGKADVYGIFTNYALVNSEKWDLRLNLGFDYKNIKNYLLGAQNSRDKVRLFKVGTDSDSIDSWGRTVIAAEVGQGIPDFMGGMDSKDPLCSRTGGGGRFTKLTAYLFRLQSLPWETSFLWKNQAQYTNNILVASEQMQIGGPLSVRGYPPAEYSGDKGFYTSPEFSFPIYCLPKDWKVPYNQEKFYDTSRLVLFYDLGTAHLRNAAAGERKIQTLKGWGFGFRFNLRDDIAFRVEIGYPLGHKTPSDSDHAHPWVEFTSMF